MLAEVFTRPLIMEYLAKVGFSRWYTYFTWRNTARGIEEYLTQLTGTPVADYFRPNFSPNTPDTPHADLQLGGRPTFVARLALAATLAANYGIYGRSSSCSNTNPATPARRDTSSPTRTKSVTETSTAPTASPIW
jgi:starch synthase (maltosyl-transferring)